MVQVGVGSVFAVGGWLVRMNDLVQVVDAVLIVAPDILNVTDGRLRLQRVVTDHFEGSSVFGCYVFNLRARKPIFI